MREIWRELLRLRPYFSRKDKMGYLTLLFLMLLGALLDVIGIGAVPAFVAVLAVPEAVMQYEWIADWFEYWGLRPGPRLVTYGAITLLLIYILKNAFLFQVYQYQYKLVEQQRVQLADRLFRAYMYAPYQFILNRNTAELLRNTNAETNLIVQGVIIPLLTTIMGVLMTLFTMVLLIVATPVIALLGVVLLGGGSALFLRVVRKKLDQYGKIAKKERREVVQAVNQGLGALAEARILGREEHFRARLKVSLSNFARVTRLQQVINQSSPYIMETIAVGGLLLAVVGLILTGQEIAGILPVLALFGAATVRLKATLGKVVGGISQMQFSVPAISSVVDDLEALEPASRKRQSRKNHHEPLPFLQSIQIQGVSYTYQNADTPALRDISITIPKGTSVGLVGATGSGKSTLVSIILGLLEPDSGQVLVDGQDISLNLRGWLNRVGYIPQFIYLTDDTIARNIALGVADADMDYDRVWSALRAAQLTEYVHGLSEGIHTIVGERGVRMSGGQRQRVGIARALYHNPDVIIMDEATSALDNQTESLVMEALDNLKAGRTFIMIAHRLSTVQQCDQLYFLEQGEVMASGTYEELTKQNEAFRLLATLPS